MAHRLHYSYPMKTTNLQAARFAAWLTAEGFLFLVTPTPAQMLLSPSSLTGAQRTWLVAFVKEITMNSEGDTKC